MEAANQNQSALTVGENRALLAKQMEKNRRVYEETRRLKNVKYPIKHAKYLHDVNIHYEQMAALHERLLYDAIMRGRKRDALKNAPPQPLEIKTRWLQHQYNTLTNNASH